METHELANPEAMCGRVLGGKYEVLRLLGAGGMGAVYEARHRDLGTAVALKVLLSESPEYALRFEREAAALARIDHRSVVRVVDFGRDPSGPLYLAMEHVRGVDLQRLVHEHGPIPLERVVALGADVLAGLAAVHDVGVLHRDMKPSNVLLTRGRDDEGRTVELAKLCDFGIASAAPEAAAGPSSDPLTRAGFVVGTPEYMAPEQALGKPLSPRADLYAVGVMLYELATGTRPFRGASPVEIALQHVSAEPPRPSSRALVPASFDAFCMRALRKDPDERFSDARAMRRALLDLLREGASAEGDAAMETVATARLEAPRAANPGTSGSFALEEPAEDESFRMLEPPKRSTGPWTIGAIAAAGVLGAWWLAQDDAPRAKASAAGTASVTVAATGATAIARRPAAVGTPRLAPLETNAPPEPEAAPATPPRSRALVVRSTDVVEPAQGGVRVAPASPKTGPLAVSGDPAAGVAPATLPNQAPTVADALQEIRRALGSVTRVQAGPGLADADLASQADRAKRSLEACTMRAAGGLRPGNLGEVVARLQVSPEGKVIGVALDDARWPAPLQACAQRAFVGMYLPHANASPTSAILGLGLLLE